MRYHACPCCQSPLEWKSVILCCAGCGLWQASVEPRILDEQTWLQLDEQARSSALRQLRQHNYRLILKQLSRLLVPNASRVLDVGCAHGWFVLQAVAAGFVAEGIEPDPRLARFAREQGVAVTQGFFSSALPAEKRFNALVFNDVFEHLPEPIATLGACARHLDAGGLLVLNIPLASGVFFSLSRALDRAGITAPWRRQWQLDFPSPHLFFYRRHHLQRMADAAGFDLLQSTSLPSIIAHGLWSRMQMDPTKPRWVYALLYPLLLLMVPLSRLLPADIGLLIFRKRDS